MKQLFALITVLWLAGCSVGAPPETPPAESATQAPPAPAPAPQPQPVTPPPPAPALPKRSGPTRDELRDTLLALLNQPGDDPLARVKVYAEEQKWKGRGERPYVEADLDGDGEPELAAAVGVYDRPDDRFPEGAALFVVYRKDGQWAVDRSDPMPERAEVWLMQPSLFGAADLTGAGHPQIIWFRPETIATGPQPFSVFVTSWQPGSFTNLPGAMAISFSKGKGDVPYLALEGKDLLLSGSQRFGWPEVPDRTDRYRFVNGAFRLVDRRLQQNGTTGYDRLWDGLVAENVGRTADAEQAYRDAADPKRQAHSGQIWLYGIAPNAKKLTDAELTQFAEALRPYARFRLGGMLLQAGRSAEAQAVLKSDGGPYAGLTDAMRTAVNRQAGCAAATAWATANPGFLKALNLGTVVAPWTPEQLCTHDTIEDSYMGNH
ncbi:MAG: hypothetical protein ACM3XM_18325 [Mycobacterium leprae]